MFSVFRIQGGKHLKDGLKGSRGHLHGTAFWLCLKWGKLLCIILPLKLKRPVHGNPRQRSGVHRKRTLQSAARISKLSGAGSRCERGTERGTGGASKRTGHCLLPPPGVASECHLPACPLLWGPPSPLPSSDSV